MHMNLSAHLRRCGSSVCVNAQEAVNKKKKKMKQTTNFLMFKLPVIKYMQKRLINIMSYKL